MVPTKNHSKQKKIYYLSGRLYLAEKLSTVVVVD